MRLDEIAVKLYEALQDGLPTRVIIEKMVAPHREFERYLLDIAGTEYKISKQIALNAISRNVPVYNKTNYLFK